jgi:pyridoxal phosphate enzyme (YggS family)
VNDAGAEGVDAIAGRLEKIRSRIEAAALRVGRDPREVALLGVSKRKSAAQVTAAIRAGLRDVGENYVQEAVAKHREVTRALDEAGDVPPRWHFIGRLQRNKVRQVVSRFDVVQTPDRESLGSELEKRASAAGRVIEALVQVDLCDEPQKGGVAPSGLAALLEASTRWAALRVTGLMAIPEATDDPESTRSAFAQLRALRDAHRQAPGGEALGELSMGMSADFEVAIEEGATIIRVGTALFGPREPLEAPEPPRSDEG